MHETKPGISSDQTLLWVNDISDVKLVTADDQAFAPSAGWLPKFYRPVDVPASQVPPIKHQGYREISTDIAQHPSWRRIPTVEGVENIVAEALTTLPQGE